jgi:glutamate-1-semialdehyde 2,1-aminomutase
MSIYVLVEERLKELISQWERIYVERSVRSRELYERAKRVFPAGVTYGIRFFEPYPLYIVRARGTRVWDADGNEYIDLWMGHGTHVLGHAPDFVVEAVNKVSRDGTHLGYENPYAVEYAEFLTRILPGVEMIRFTMSGTEANMYALRLARACTRRSYVIKFEGGWHGGYDALHTYVSLPGGPESAGLPEDYLKYTLAAPYNDLDAVEKLLKRYPVAAIVVEPVMGAGGCIAPIDGFLKGLRQLADEYGALLIFDEVITGFRLALGGGQEFFNVRADIVVYGKAIGGGYPGAGAFGGRAEVMELLDHIKYPDPRVRSFHGGTFTGNPINMVAGHTLIRYLAEHRSIYEQANNLWNWARREVDRACEEHERVCWVTGAGTMTGVHFTRTRPRNYAEARDLRWGKNIEKALHLYMRINGVLYMTEKTVHFLPALSQPEEEVKKVVELFRQFLDTVAKH